MGVHRWTTLVLSAVLGLALAVIAGPAQATSGSGNQNPDLTAAISVASSGIDPDRATAGDVITVHESVTNNTGTAQKVTIVRTSEGPGLRSKPSATTVTVGPLQSFDFTYSYTVMSGAPVGTYTRSVSASIGKRGTASFASGSYVVY